MARDLRAHARAARVRLDQSRPTAQELVTARRRLDQALGQRKRRGRWLWLVAPALAGTFALVWVFTPSIMEPSWYRVAQGFRCLVPKGDHAQVRAGCDEPVVLKLAAGLVTLGESSKLSREHQAVRLERGIASFRVPFSGVAFRVNVSHGAIITLSTLFEVEQHDKKGRVTVVEGRIRFEWDDGSGSEEVKAGQTLRWPKPKPSVAQPESPEPRVKPRPAKVRATRPEAAEKPAAVELEPETAEQELEAVGSKTVAPDVRAVMQRLSQLRSQRRDQEAVELLREASRRDDFSAQQQERLSFEAGKLIADQLDDQQAACAHWREHLQRFPDGARAIEVQLLWEDCP